MPPRLNPFVHGTDLLKSYLAFSNGVVKAGLEQSLIHLVEIRASQINGCANCIHMHTRDARQHGETEERIYLLDAWREAPFYSDRERAALGWTEALTLVADTGAPDESYEALKAHFSEEEQMQLTLMIIVINGWNRLSIGFRLFQADASAVRSAA